MHNGRTMLNIRFEPTQASEPCPCGCGGRVVSLTRFVESDGEPIAVYFARYTTTHAERQAAATLSLGNFAEGSTPAERQAFAWAIRADGQPQYEVTLLEAAQSPWREVEMIGRTLGREEAAAHPRADEAWALLAQLIDHDPNLTGYLRPATATATATATPPPPSA